MTQHSFSYRRGWKDLDPWTVGAATAMIGLAMTAWLYLVLGSAATREDIARIERVADRVIASLQRETDLALAFQSSVAAKIGLSPQIGVGEYREFLTALRVFDLLPSIRAMAFAPLIESADLARYVAETNAQPERAELGYPAFLPWPESVRDLHAPAVLVEPQVSNSRVYNFDLYSSYERRATGERSIATGLSQASAPVVLTQDAETGALSVLILHPVLMNGLPFGLVAMGVTIERLLQPILLPLAGGEVRLTIEDIGTADVRSAPKLLLGLGGKPESKTVDRLFRFAGREWQIQIGADQPTSASAEIWVASLGIALSLASGFIVVRALDERRELKRAVVMRTRRLTAANRILRVQSAALTRANAAKSEFLGRLGHELRTPLNAIIGFSEILKLGLGGGALPPRQAEYVGDIHSSGEHLLDLINRLLDLVRLEQDRMTIEQAAFDLTAEIDAAIAMLRPVAAERDISIKLVQEGVVDLALGDPVALRQVSINLIENAIKFTPKGGTISVTLTQEGAEVTVSFDDSGIGIPADELARIFEPFHQVETGDTRRFEGAGLGLAIVAGLMKEMRGRVTVTSTPGHGSRFRIDLPIAGETR